jgi:hypothetical protein
MYRSATDTLQAAEEGIMSIDTTRIHCTGCDFEYFENYRPVTLKCKLEGGPISYSSTTAWCYVCDTIKLVEQLPTEEEIRAVYAEYYGIPGPKVSGLKKLMRSFDRTYQEKIRQMERKLAWRQIRTSPPHCLTCGSTNLGHLDYTGKGKQTARSEPFRTPAAGY